MGLVHLAVSGTRIEEDNNLLVKVGTSPASFERSLKVRQTLQYQALPGGLLVGT